MFQLTANKEFTVSMQEKEICSGVRLLTLVAKCVSEPSRLEMCLEWETDNVGVNMTWNPTGYVGKGVPPSWGGCFVSNASSSAPVLSCVSFDDSNRQTVACSDAKNTVFLRSGAVEETGKLLHQVIMKVECDVASYRAEVRIDTRRIPFYRCVEDVVAWWESFDGYLPAPVPQAAREPMYSTWYSFHQNIDVPRILEECRYFAELGCKSVIVDDGWQTADSHRGYQYCGDWMPATEKVADMRGFVDAVHQLGMKFILWYSVPFVGVHSKAYERFRDQVLYQEGEGTYVLDPRYPEVRQYLIGLYRDAVINWGLDGFKLDFVDSFRQSGEVKEGMDYVSVYDAVDRMMKDVIATLRELNPEILIEFRQRYIGPLMKTFGNMFRAGDCPNDSRLNRQSTLALRMTSGRSAVHSDMVMWNIHEPVELAAFQLTNVLFAVPQISVLSDQIPEDHARMVKSYLAFWTRYRQVLLDGEMTYRNYGADFSYVSSRLGQTQVGAVYSGRIASLEVQTDEILLVNTSCEREILIEASFAGDYAYSVCDCMGNQTATGIVTFGDARLHSIPVPVNGIVTLNRSV